LIRLHYHPRSTYSRRVRIVLVEKRIAHDLVSVDMAARAHRQPAYRALNPYARVPTLEDDGFALYESTAILEYLELCYPQPPLVPGDARGRALVSMHMKLCDLEMAPPTSSIIFPKRFLPRERRDEAEMARSRSRIQQHLQILERQLDDRAYLVADTYTLADVCYTPFVYFLPLMEIEPPPAVAAWCERLLTRPSARDTEPDR